MPDFLGSVPISWAGANKWARLPRPRPCEMQRGCGKLSPSSELSLELLINLKTARRRHAGCRVRRGRLSGPSAVCPWRIVVNCVGYVRRSRASADDEQHGRHVVSVGLSARELRSTSAGGVGRWSRSSPTTASAAASGPDSTGSSRGSKRRGRRVSSQAIIQRVLDLGPISPRGGGDVS